jgi:hypothetical protein
MPADGFETAARISGWRFPSATDGEGGAMEMRPGSAGHYKLRDEALEASPWLTPSASEDAAGNPGARMRAMLGSQAKLAPLPGDGISGGSGLVESREGWISRTGVRDWRARHTLVTQRARQDFVPDLG